MKIAYIITAYHKEKQLQALIDSVISPDVIIYIHIDVKSSINIEALRKDYTQYNNVTFIDERYNVYWGGFNQLKSILALIANVRNSNTTVDYVVLLSGQDYPIKSKRYIDEFFQTNLGKSFLYYFRLPSPIWAYGLGRVQWFWFMDTNHIRGVWRLQRTLQILFKKFGIKRKNTADREFYGGSDWWMLHATHAFHCLDVFEKDADYAQIFKYSFIPSEMFFHSVLLNSAYKDQIVDNNYRLTIWEEGAGNPNILSINDLDVICESECLFARKFDFEQYPEMLPALKELNSRN